MPYAGLDLLRAQQKLRANLRLHGSRVDHVSELSTGLLLFASRLMRHLSSKSSLAGGSASGSDYAAAATNLVITLVLHPTRLAPHELLSCHTAWLCGISSNTQACCMHTFEGCPCLSVALGVLTCWYTFSVCNGRLLRTMLLL